ncbi:G-PROTEIN-RECEP-F1-2 domain-containing protein [Aphelenchoides fujianensis]|nr:G-PROTEIN-RECEP-F1-2 domain-containing protein [Aphelenchoides fujianensis]
MDLTECVDVNEIMAIVGDWTLRLDVQIIFSLVYILIFIVGLIGNGLLIAKIRKKMTVANVFLINLAISDLLLCITALPITPVLAFIKRWIFGGIMCKLVPLCQGISVLISSYCLCLIAVDRYRTIVTPLRIPFTIVQAQIFMIVCWLGAVVVSSTTPPSAGSSAGNTAGRRTPEVKLAYGSTLLIFQYLIPVSILTFCYWKILQKVGECVLFAFFILSFQVRAVDFLLDRNMSKRNWGKQSISRSNRCFSDWLVQQGSMLTKAQQQQTAVRKRRVMYILILMVAIFLGSWLPLTIANILRDIGNTYLDSQMYFKLLSVHAIAMTSIVSNPMLYFWLSKRHRSALKKDMNLFTNYRKSQQGLLERFGPPNRDSVGIIYRKSLHRHLLGINYNPYRRGTLADPTCITRERVMQDELQANCFLLVPLVPLVLPTRNTSTADSSSDGGLPAKDLSDEHNNPSFPFV